ncbi:MAG: protein-L-isoaspartate O-methyltransferase, partial [Pseudomonadota bacterium]|nr:protein-L-isoaspartate O-methyltransferase [Pseudomonadota bacterium]
LADRAREKFHLLNVTNVRQKHDDGNLGWPDEGPFDAILVTAASRGLPDALLEQLAEGGRMVIPVGDGDVQELKVIDRMGDAWQQETADYVRFVPLVGGIVR